MLAALRLREHAHAVAQTPLVAALVAVAQVRFCGSVVIFLVFVTHSRFCANRSFVFTQSVVSLIIPLVAVCVGSCSCECSQSASVQGVAAAVVAAVAAVMVQVCLRAVSSTIVV